MHDLVLAGCAADTLISYLKALGVLRTVAEDTSHGDALARGWWRDGAFVLRSKFEAHDLAQFFLGDYRPTPIVVPWSGGDFFGVRLEGDIGPYEKAPTSTRIIEAFLASRGERLQTYRETLLHVLTVMEREGVRAKSDIEGTRGKRLKGRLLSALRSEATEQVGVWIDAAAVIEEGAAFNVLLGSGGGSDGNTHYSDNFMQSLWDSLPEFAEQGSRRAKIEYVENALFGTPVANLSDRTPSLFSSGGVGGPNATQGFTGASLLNSWDFILGLEGTLCFAGAVTRKLGTAGGAPAFPFSVSLTAAGYGTAVDKEEGQTEIWFPVWDRPLRIQELDLLFSEGRSQTTRKISRTGTDFARAVASHGVDAGVDRFERFAFVKGRVGGENYTTAVPLGTFVVKERKDNQLLIEIDGWLDRFRRACKGDDTPPRFTAALRRIDKAIVEFCRYGGQLRIAAILCALGNAEHELANGERFRQNEKRTIQPAGPLSVAWVRACNDGSPEFRLAAAAAGVIGDGAGRVGDLRENLEPVSRQNGRLQWRAGRTAVWRAGSIAKNLATVLWRRLVEAEQQALNHPPLRSRARAEHGDVTLFLRGGTDDIKLEEFLWGLALLDRHESWSCKREPFVVAEPLPRAYALLKLTFLPAKLNLNAFEYEIWPDVEILGKLRGLHVKDACRLAARRLRYAGIIPAWDGAEQSGIDAERLAAALLFPVWDEPELARMVIRMDGSKKGEVLEA